ncbi:Ldh family oxidoreductase [soil metagenome]
MRDEPQATRIPASRPALRPPGRYASHDVKRWVEGVLSALGFSEADAAYLADTLLDANLRGIDSHGVMRLPVYAQRIRSGLVRPDATPAIRRDGAVIHVDAASAAGQLATRAALEAVADVAAVEGVACAVVRGSAHFGTAGYYARWLATRSCIGIVVSNSESIVVPHGGSDAVLGTNPVAFAAPREERPISLDMATSASAMGRVMIAGARGDAIPLGWGVDGAGVPTTVPADVHALLPLGGAKGYGLSVLVEVLAGVLSGAAIAGGIGNMYRDHDRPQDVGHFLLALHVPHFLPSEAFANRIEHLATQLIASRPAPGFDEVMLPGEPEERAKEEREREGIPVEDATRAELDLLGATVGLPFPAAMGPDAEVRES